MASCAASDERSCLGHCLVRRARDNKELPPNPCKKIILIETEALAMDACAESTTKDGKRTAGWNPHGHGGPGCTQAVPTSAASVSKVW